MEIGKFNSYSKLDIRILGRMFVVLYFSFLKILFLRMWMVFFFFIVDSLFFYGYLVYFLNK